MWRSQNSEVGEGTIFEGKNCFLQSDSKENFVLLIFLLFYPLFESNISILSLKVIFLDKNVFLNNLEFVFLMPLLGGVHPVFSQVFHLWIVLFRLMLGSHYRQQLGRGLVSPTTHTLVKHTITSMQFQWP